MKTALVLSMSLFWAPFAAAESCHEFDSSSVELKWTAYKTPMKAGVSGYFRGIESEGKVTGSSPLKAFRMAKLKIVPSPKNVDTGDKARDKKIADFFFRSEPIEAWVLEVNEEKKSLVLAVRMFGKKKTPGKVHLAYELDGDAVTAKGHLDIFDFRGGKRLKALNKACFAKHEGKTWSDVAVEVRAKTKPCK